MIGALSLGLYLGLYQAPADVDQGEFARLMYVHVPSCWLALMAYMLAAGAAGAGLVWRTRVAFFISHRLLQAGLIACIASLVSGSLWGRFTWGVWWVWDARLTSVLVLAFFYAAAVATYHAFRGRDKSMIMAAYVTILGSINVPIIKWSVTWWSTLHQPASLSRLAKPAMPIEMWGPLVLVFIGLVTWGAVMVIRGVQVDLQQAGQR